MDKLKWSTQTDSVGKKAQHQKHSNFYGCTIESVLLTMCM